MSDTGCITEWGPSGDWATDRGCMNDLAAGRQCGQDPGPNPLPPVDGPDPDPFPPIPPGPGPGIGHWTIGIGGTPSGQGEFAPSQGPLGQVHYGFWAVDTDGRERGDELLALAGQNVVIQQVGPGAMTMTLLAVAVSDARPGGNWLQLTTDTPPFSTFPDFQGLPVYVYGPVP